MLCMADINDMYDIDVYTIYINSISNIVWNCFSSHNALMPSPNAEYCNT